MEDSETRFHNLTAVLNYTAEDTDKNGSKGGKTGLLTTGERIVINQERAYLLNQQNEHPTIRPYVIAMTLEKKVQYILKTIL